MGKEESRWISMEIGKFYRVGRASNAKFGRLPYRRSVEQGWPHGPTDWRREYEQSELSSLLRRAGREGVELNLDHVYTLLNVPEAQRRRFQVLLIANALSARQL